MVVPVVPEFEAQQETDVSDCNRSGIDSISKFMNDPLWAFLNGTVKCAAVPTPALELNPIDPPIRVTSCDSG